MTIQETILCVMRSVGAIGKDQKNAFDKYMFRGIDDVYNVLGPAFAEHGMFVVPEVLSLDMDTFTTSNGAVQQRALVRVKYVFTAEDGSTLSAVSVGEGADRGDKCVNKAMSSAFKTALFQTLCIPTHEKTDSEFQSPEHDAGPQPAATAQPDLTDPQSIVASFKRLAAGRALSCELPNEAGLQVLVDSMRAAGVADADGGNYPGRLVTALRAPDFEPKLRDVIEAWMPPIDDPAFEGGESA